MGQLVYTLAMFVGGLVIAFWKGPIFTLIVIAYMPIMVVFGALFGRRVKANMFRKLGQSKKMGALTEETLSAMKLVVSFAQEDHAVGKFDAVAEETNSAAKSASLAQAGMTGVFLTTMFGFFVYSYAVGSWLIESQTINPTTGEVYSAVEIIQVSQATMMAIMTIAGISNIVPAIVKALVVGKKVFDLIDREPLIRSPATSAKSAHSISIDSGIQFENIEFRYPTQPEKSRNIFQGATFTIKPYTSTAIVGPSGSGKSTIVQLLNRFYDPQEG